MAWSASVLRGRLEGLANQYANLGVIYEVRGDLDEARDLWIKSRDLFQKIGIPHMVSKVEGWLDGLNDSSTKKP